MLQCAVTPHKFYNTVHLGSSSGFNAIVCMVEVKFVYDSVYGESFNTVACMVKGKHEFKVCMVEVKGRHKRAISSVVCLLILPLYIRDL